MPPKSVNHQIMVLLALSLVGIFLLGNGITGFLIISQSCCFPPHCDAENLCDAAKIVSSTEGRRHAIFLSLGAFMIAGSLLSVLKMQKMTK
ncbi:hypothetical protein HZB02_07670 [Candidatus Woesearchaeota archaeon]|nr:hypothetical protein [Candidatus Woesearchaeota archaeon]